MDGADKRSVAGRGAARSPVVHHPGGASPPLRHTPSLKNRLGSQPHSPRLSPPRAAWSGLVSPQLAPPGRAVRRVGPRALASVLADPGRLWATAASARAPRAGPASADPIYSDLVPALRAAAPGRRLAWGLAMVRPTPRPHTKVHKVRSIGPASRPAGKPAGRQGRSASPRTDPHHKG